jgi:hypothetical protein
MKADNYKNPIKSFERRLAPDFATREFRNPAMRSVRSTGTGGGGLGSLRHTMPHLKPSIRLQGGGVNPVGEIYAASRPNLYNPDPLARAILGAQRRTASKFTNPDMRAMPGSTAGFADGGPAEEEELPEEPMAAMEGGDDPDGGEDPGQQQRQHQIVVEAMLALEGRHPGARQALKAFVEAFGPEALEELKEMMTQGSGEQEEAGEEEEEGAEPPEEEEEEEDLAGASGGLLSGPGSGQSDEIEGSTPSGRPVLLSDGEYVIDAPTVAALGDGSTNAGAKRLDEMRKQIRKEAYGHEKQAKPMKNGGRAVLVQLGK